ncbi:MAG: pyridoxal phosphate-dependent aminotransferase [Candidatus Sericytochromatia bacterium]
MPITPSPLERWFTTHPAPCALTVAPIAVQPPGWEALAEWLSPEWAGSEALAYAEPQGDAGLRGLIAESCGVGPEQVLLTTGGVEANWMALAAVIRPGDRVIVQTPSYPQLACAAEALGAVVVPWTVPASLAEPVDLAALEGLMAAPTRLVVLNTPHNPTGRVLNEDTLLAIARLVERQPDAYWLVDEVYRGVGDAPLPPPAIALSERAIMTHSASKAMALPGLRVGWVVGPEAVIASALPWMEHQTLALSGLSVALLKAIWDHREALIDANRAVARRNRAIVRAWLAERPHLTGDVADSAVCFLLGTDGGLDDVTLAEAWYAERACFAIPGTTLGYPGTLRVGYGHRDEAALVAALAFLAERLAPMARALSR